ncbi:hypothetical protein IWX88_001890 [Frigoribacterium sp. CG_9.8]|nr:hypothetical protein [Frigoribacterium sp. CG_9.8]
MVVTPSMRDGRTAFLHTVFGLCNFVPFSVVPNARASVSDVLARPVHPPILGPLLTMPDYVSHTITGSC